MSSSSIEQIKLENLDNLELFSTTNSNQNFPLHYHETFCISVIEKGAFVENNKIALQNSVLVSNPLEIHKNSTFQNIDYSIKTLYVSKDIFSFALGITSLDNSFLLQNLITDTSLFDKINGLSSQIINNESKKIEFENNLLECIKSLYKFRVKSIGDNEKESFSSILPNWIEDTKQYLNVNLDQKISLERLTKRTTLDKFQFIREFKKHIGLTPFQYIVLSRISLTKKLLQEGKPIIETALNAGFYDQSSFTNYFKRYVGVTPKMYQKSFNIVQD